MREPQQEARGGVLCVVSDSLDGLILRHTEQPGDDTQQVLFAWLEHRLELSVGPSRHVSAQPDSSAASSGTSGQAVLIP